MPMFIRIWKLICRNCQEQLGSFTNFKDYDACHRLFGKMGQCGHWICLFCANGLVVPVLRHTRWEPTVPCPICQADDAFEVKLVGDRRWQHDQLLKRLKLFNKKVAAKREEAAKRKEAAKREEAAKPKPAPKRRRSSDVSGPESSFLHRTLVLGLYAAICSGVLSFIVEVLALR